MGSLLTSIPKSFIHVSYVFQLKMMTLLPGKENKNMSILHTAHVIVNFKTTDHFRFFLGRVDSNIVSRGGPQHYITIFKFIRFLLFKIMVSHGSWLGICNYFSCGYGRYIFCPSLNRKRPKFHLGGFPFLNEERQT